MFAVNSQDSPSLASCSESESSNAESEADQLVSPSKSEPAQQPEVEESQEISTALSNSSSDGAQVEQQGGTQLFANQQLCEQYHYQTQQHLQRHQQQQQQQQRQQQHQPQQMMSANVYLSLGPSEERDSEPAQDNIMLSPARSTSSTSGSPLATAEAGSRQQHDSMDEKRSHHHHHNQQHSQPQPQHQGFEEVKQVNLFGESIVALTINGKERLCLAQISNTLLKDFSYNEIHNRRVALGITCVQCTPIQLEMLRRAGAMPSSSRRCGMITRREAERLCRSFLVEEQPPELPENFYFTVAHRINYGCKGRFIPARYISSRAKCIECFYCGDLYSPNKFIFHSHRQPHVNECNPPDSPNINSWRKHIDLDWTLEHSQEIRYAWEDVKSLFNGGTRRRTAAAAAAAAAAASAAAAAASAAASTSGSTILTNSAGLSTSAKQTRDNNSGQQASRAAQQQANLNKATGSQRKACSGSSKQQQKSQQQGNSETILLSSPADDNADQLIDVERLFDVERLNCSLPISGPPWQRATCYLAASSNKQTNMTCNQATGGFGSAAKLSPADLSVAYNQPIGCPAKRSSAQLAATASPDNKKCNYSDSPQTAQRTINVINPCGDNNLHSSHNRKQQSASMATLTAPPAPSQNMLEDQSFVLNAAHYLRKQQLSNYGNLHTSSDSMAMQQSGQVASSTAILAHPKQEPLNCSPLSGLQLPARALNKPLIEPLIGQYPVPTVAAAAAASNLLYNQLHSQLMQPQQTQHQGQPLQLGSTNIDAQFALRHHLWSSLLANLQCNPVSGAPTFK